MRKIIRNLWASPYSYTNISLCDSIRVIIYKGVFFGVAAVFACLLWQLFRVIMFVRNNYVRWRPNAPTPYNASFNAEYSRVASIETCVCLCCTRQLYMPATCAKRLNLQTHFVVLIRAHPYFLSYVQRYLYL